MPIKLIDCFTLTVLSASVLVQKNVQIFLHIKYAENYQIAVKKLRKTNDKNNHDITSIVLLSLAETI